MKVRILLALALTAAAASAQGICGKECLRGLLDSYMLAMSRHDPGKLNASDKLKFTENGESLKLGEGFWKTAGSATYRLYALDPQGGAAALEAVVRENGQLTNFLLRIRVAGKAISEAETIVCRKGEAGFFAPEKLTGNPVMMMQIVAPAERHTRKELAAIADAYFTAVQTEGTPGYRPAPFAEDADRFENGERTTNVEVMGMPAAAAAEQLDKGYFKGLTIGKRRFPVIDVEHGMVLGIGLMGTPGPDGVLLAEMFKITGGKIHQVQAVMVNHPKTGPTGWNER